MQAVRLAGAEGSSVIVVAVVLAFLFGFCAGCIFLSWRQVLLQQRLEDEKEFRALNRPYRSKVFR
jgi:hypothetical protein